MPYPFRIGHDRQEVKQTIYICKRKDAAAADSILQLIICQHIIMISKKINLLQTILPC